MDLHLGKPSDAFCSGKQTRELTPGRVIYFFCVLHDGNTFEGIHLQNTSNEISWGRKCQQGLDGWCMDGTECETDTAVGQSRGVYTTVLCSQTSRQVEYDLVIKLP